MTAPRGRIEGPDSPTATYDLTPAYPIIGGTVEVGYLPLASEIGRTQPGVLAIDGPAALDWARVVGRLTSALAAAGLRLHAVDVRRHLLPWAQVERLTDGSALKSDPEFARLCPVSLRSLFGSVPTGLDPPTGHDVSIVFGPGAALVDHDRLCYADVPKRLSPQAIRDGAPNLGAAPGSPGTQRRLSFVDWPAQDRHKQEWLTRFDRYLDLTNAEEPRSLNGAVLRRSLRGLAGGPFRTRPVFSPGAWGGQWLRRRLGVPTDAPNLAWSYELITPESGILLGDDNVVEVGFELLMAEAGRLVLGDEVSERFGESFPIRFDYLDTMDGGNLSVHCHPRPAYMRETFGWPYTQHETYYVMATRPGCEVLLGLRGEAALEDFQAEAGASERSGTAFDVRRYVQTFPAEEHQLFLIPAGTPHASGEGNVVLEISSTPYLYSLRFYDWLRADLEGGLRPVHLTHAFANLDTGRHGQDVSRQLVQEPRVVRTGPGFVELDLGRHPELFFAVHRLDFDDHASDDTAGRFHVLNLVEGEQVVLSTVGGRRHRLAYAETIVIPAGVGGYRLEAVRGGPCKVVKAFVIPT